MFREFLSGALVSWSLTSVFEADRRFGASACFEAGIKFGGRFPGLRRCVGSLFSVRRFLTMPYVQRRSAVRRFVKRGFFRVRIFIYDLLWVYSSSRRRGVQWAFLAGLNGEKRQGWRLYNRFGMMIYNLRRWWTSR